MILHLLHCLAFDSSLFQFVFQVNGVLEAGFMDTAGYGALVDTTTQFVDAVVSLA